MTTKTDSEAEKTYVGNIYSMNNVQSANVHKNYNIAFAYNSDKLISLSSMLGVLELHNTYYKNIRTYVEYEKGDYYEQS